MIREERFFFHSVLEALIWAPKKRMQALYPKTSLHPNSKLLPTITSFFALPAISVTNMLNTKSPFLVFCLGLWFSLQPLQQLLLPRNISEPLLKRTWPPSSSISLSCEGKEPLLDSPGLFQYNLHRSLQLLPASTTTIPSIPLGWRWK